MGISTLIVGKGGIIFFGVFLLILLTGSIFYFLNITKSSNPQVLAAGINEANLKTYTASELKRYDGTDSNLSIYIALEGLVYDVTEGKKFYEPGGAYHGLAGRDSTSELRIFGGDIIKRKYPVVGRFAE